MSLDQITIRPAETGDAHCIAKVHDTAWRHTYRGIIPGVALERMVQRRGPHWWAKLIRQRRGILALEVGRRVVGYTTFGANRSRALQASGEIYEIYIDPIYQGLGFGKRLFGAALERLADKGQTDCVVWVLEDNAAAVDFYHAMGGNPVAHGVERFIGTPAQNNACRKLAFTWESKTG
ncbi:MAG: N-acetyltransferase family protein [Devosiaceae bacterium]